MMVDVERSTGAVTCAECDKVLSAKYLVRLHFEAVHQSIFRYYFCFDCQDQRQRQRRPFLTHLSTHLLTERPKAIVCFECKKSYASGGKALLRAHIGSDHNGEEAPSMSCFECSKIFFGRQGLKLHLALTVNHSALDKNIAFKCFTCNRSFGRLKRELIAHCRKFVRTFACFECHAIIPSRFTLLHHFASCPSVCHFDISCCYDCNRSYSSRQKLIDHCVFVHRPTRSKLFRCKICDYACEFSRILKKHVEKVHLKKTSACCEQCQKRFYDQGDLAKHLKKVHVSAAMKLRCYECATAFPDLRKLGQHQLVHFDNALFACDVCEKTCKGRQEVISHVVVHSGRRRHACESCQKTYLRKEHLCQHVKKVHGSGRNENVALRTCFDCRRVFTRTTGLKLHIDVVHRKLPKTHQCAVCLKSVNSRRALQAHVLCHKMDEKSLKCDECFKTFSQKGYLSHHLLDHIGADGDKTHRCRQCQYSTHYLSHLKLHQQSVHGNNYQHKCAVCGKQFHQSSHLRRHEKVHSECYRCHDCEEELKTKKALRIHCKEVHLGK